MITIINEIKRNTGSVLITMKIMVVMKLETNITMTKFEVVV